MLESQAQPILQIALQRHHAGRLAEAEQLYRQVLASCPDSAEALHYLGVLAGQVGKRQAAIELIERACQLDPGVSTAWNNLGTLLRDTGQPAAAEAAHRRAVQLNPAYAEAHLNLGIALSDQNRWAEAIIAYRAALALDGNSDRTCNNLGVALRHAGQWDEAMEMLRRAIALNPKSADAFDNLGVLLRDHGQLEAAVQAHTRSFELNPASANAFNNLALALRDLGRLEQALAAGKTAISLKGDYANAYLTMGITLKHMGRFEESAAACEKAIALQPSYGDAYINLGSALVDLGRFDEAVVACRRGVELKPGDSIAYNNLGAALSHGDDLDDAISTLENAISLRPDFADAIANLAGMQAVSGQIDLAIRNYRRAIMLEPTMARAYSCLLVYLNYHVAATPEDVYDEHWVFNMAYAAELERQAAPHANHRSAHRRLRVGYVSPDFCAHACSFYSLPLLSHHDAARFEIYCYAQLTRKDATTERFRAVAGNWRDISQLTDEQAAALIRADQIDILVNLGLHTAGGRPLLFARRPAPIQVAWLGYPGTTGLTTIDYRLTDPYLDPPGMHEAYSFEQLVRLPDSFWCYDPGDVWEVAVHPLPACEKGYVTFGCLNNFCKINPPMLDLWAQILLRTENSRLVILAPLGRHRQRTLDYLQQAGLDPARVEFATPMPRREYLELYNRIDLGLDSFPYNGHTTSLDSLAMGVPVVSLYGQPAVSRAGLGFLTNLNLPDLASDSREQYMHIAVQLAKDLPRLADMRASLRQRMLNSPLTHTKRFAANIEAAYLQMWSKWIRQKGT